MGSELRVAPAGLRAASAGETAVSRAIAALGVGEVLGTAASAMSGLQSGAACAQVSLVVDAAVQSVGSEVGAHAGKLTDAADAYQRTDDEYARRLDAAKPAG